MATDRPHRASSELRRVAAVCLILVVSSLQFSIVVSQSILALTVAAWLAVLVTERRRPSAPRFALPLAVYAGLTVLSAALSADAWASLADCKQLVLLLLVPITYELMTGRVAGPAATISMSAGAASALVGIAQYALLNYDSLGLRPRSTLGMYMTFSGLIMLILGLALAQVLFARRGRTWPALVVPALSLALALTMSRNAWIGACAALGLLLLLKDFRLLALLPIVAAVFLTIAPEGIVERFYSIFDLRDPTNRDRVAMAQAGQQIIREHPLVGVGPAMIAREYPAYRLPGAVLETTPHLHNVPLHIAAERGLPALAVWLWFIGLVTFDLWQVFRSSNQRWLPAAGLAAIVAMLAAGMFEYNFGDSEFQMLFLFLIALPFAARRP